MTIIDQEKIAMFRDMLVWLAREDYEPHANEREWIPWAEKRIEELSGRDQRPGAKNQEA